VREGREEGSAYRIVQEAFTNILKHAGPADARVQVCYGDRELEIEVAEDGRGPNRSSGRGHGLVGRSELLARDVLHRALGVLGPISRTTTSTSAIPSELAAAMR
jgi:glucose-6-phosphate-specific signal transduction histidine kinase